MDKTQTIVPGWVQIELANDSFMVGYAEQYTLNDIRGLMMTIPREEIGNTIRFYPWDRIHTVEVCTEDQARAIAPHLLGYVDQNVTRLEEKEKADAHIRATLDGFFEKLKRDIKPERTTGTNPAATADSFGIDVEL
jgi:hypothetical protein